MSLNDKKIRSVALLLIDLLSLGLSYLLSYVLLHDALGLLLPYGAEAMREYILILFMSFFIASLIQPQSNDTVLRTFSGEIPPVLRFNVLLVAVLAVLLLLFKSPVLDSRYLFVTLFLANAALMSLLHALYRRFMLHRFDGTDAARLIEIVTTKERAGEVLSAVRRDYRRKIVGVALLGEAPEGGTICGAPCLGSADDPEALVQGVTREAVDEILFCVPYEALLTLGDAIAEIESAGVVVHLYVPMLDRFAGAEQAATMVGGLPVMSFAAKTHAPGALALKRLFDILIGGLGLMLSVPVIALVALPLLAESRGPLFFSQTRIGRNGRPFRIYKLRSMYVDAEARKAELLEKNEMQGLMFKIKKDPRITKVGRILRATSIDELPQFFNVLRGDMSLVGPRPPLRDEFDQYLARYKRRLSMRPGITGLWQVSGRNQVLNFDDVVRLDLAYIDRWSLLLDLKILIRTVLVVIRCSGS